MKDRAPKAPGPFRVACLSVRFHTFAIAALALLFLGPITPAQGPDLGSLPLPQGAASLATQSPLVGFPDPQRAGETPSAPEKNTRASLQSGTSNDRILWTLPNFLTLENAESIPPLSPR